MYVVYVLNFPASDHRVMFFLSMEMKVPDRTCLEIALDFFNIFTLKASFGFNIPARPCEFNWFYVLLSASDPGSSHLRVHR